MAEKRELHIDLNTGKPRLAVAQTPMLTSARTPWQGVLLEEHNLPSFEADNVSFINNVVALQLEKPIRLEWRQAGRSQPIRILPGQLSLIPAGLPHSVRTRDPAHFLMVSLESRFLAFATSEFGAPDRLELMARHGFTDALVQQICLALGAEAKNGAPGGRMYGELLAATLAVHLVQNYASQRAHLREYRGGLAKHQLRRVIDFIHDHLSEDLSLNTVAGAIEMSPFHFARMFKQSTGLTPHQYLIQCRLERAKQLLIRSGASIADVAAQLGFCDQSHLAAHFKRSFGVTPRTFLREAICRPNSPEPQELCPHG